MPIYEYQCNDCGKISEFLLIKANEAFTPQCKHCKGKKMSRVLSRVRLIHSEESRMERLADPFKWGGLDEKDPKSIARWVNRMGKEMGEETDEEIDRTVDEAMEAMTSGTEDYSEDKKRTVSKEIFGLF